MFKNPLKLSLLMISIFIIGVVATQTFKDGIDVSGFIRLVEWATLYVLPWKVCQNEEVDQSVHST